MDSKYAFLRRNLPYLQQQSKDLLVNTFSSPFINLITLTTTIGYLFSFSEKAVTLLTVTPGYLLPNSADWYFWTPFTFCFVELHFWELIVDFITVVLCCKLLEPLWGQMEMFRFFAITNFGVATLTTMYYLFNYMITKNPYVLFDCKIHGLFGYVAAISVSVRQFLPDHLILKTRFGRLTNRNIPLLVLLTSLVLWLLFNILEGTYPAMFAWGLLVSWTYLRFYQWHPNGRGDSSDSFKFASFFPLFMQPVINVLVNPIYAGCLKIGLVKPPTHPPHSLSASSLSSITVSSAGVDPHDIERRRQIALKALSERLKTTDSGRYSQLPKSFPNVSGIGGHHGHHHKGAHQGHSHGHSHQHQHHQHGHKHNIYQSSAAPMPPFMPAGQHSSSTPIITTARTEPRMISTMSPIAIPMPPPPTSSDNSTSAKVADPDSTTMLIDIEPNQSNI